MAHVVRMQTECPPDAHKVIRPPEKAVKATVCVKLNEAEMKEYGAEDFCNALSLMSSKPLLMCSDELRKTIAQHKAAAEIDPCYLQISADGSEAQISYDDGAVGPSMPVVDLTADEEKLKTFLDQLTVRQFVIIDSYAMLILRSISTVFPWDPLLAGDYFRQYLKARELAKPEDLDLFIQVRYGRIDGFSLKKTHEDAYRFLQLERKLYLQYPTDDDD